MLQSKGGSVNNSITWVEATAQHWASEDGSGYYSSPLATAQGVRAEAANFSAVDPEMWHSDLACRAITAKENLDWRNILAKESLARHGQGKIAFVGLNGTTKSLADLHISHPYKLDCTHFCYTPLLWQPLWHYLATLAESLPL
jgi:hypothetical protein